MQSAKDAIGLGEIEPACEQRGRELVRLALQAHLDARGPGDVGPAILVEAPQGPLRLGDKKLHSRTVVTIFGKLQVARVAYSAPGQCSIHPLDAELCLPARCYSDEFQRRLVTAAVLGPFR